MSVLKYSGEVETCDPPEPSLGSTFSLGLSPVDTVTFDGGASLVVDVDSPCLPEPNLPDLLAQATDESQPLTARLHAAEQAAWLLRGQLERACESIFPDFWWPSSKEDYPFWLEGSEPELRFPQMRRSPPDTELTPERDVALRALGFARCEGQRLGLVGSNGQ